MASSSWFFLAVLIRLHDADASSLRRPSTSPLGAEGLPPIRAPSSDGHPSPTGGFARRGALRSPQTMQSQKSVHRETASEVESPIGVSFMQQDSSRNEGASYRTPPGIEVAEEFWKNADVPLTAVVTALSPTVTAAVILLFLVGAVAMSRNRKTVQPEAKQIVQEMLPMASGAQAAVNGTQSDGGSDGAAEETEEKVTAVVRDKTPPLTCRHPASVSKTPIRRQAPQTSPIVVQHPADESAGPAPSRGGRRHSVDDNLVQAVSALPVYTGDDIMPPKKGYDCVHVQPQEDCIALRLQGRVVAAEAGTCVSPIMGRECVIFSTSVAELRLDGVQAPPLSYHSVCQDFELEVGGATPSVRIRIRGAQVALFGTMGGKQCQQVRFGDAPETVKNFVSYHRVAGPVGGSKLSDKTVLELTESCLDVGDVVTCVGKLRRVASGELELLPCDGHLHFGDDGAVCTPLQAEKVFVSDHPDLLDPM